MTNMIREVLAAKRIVRFIAHDALLDNVRADLVDRWPPEDNRLTYLLTCEKCLSFWAGLAVCGGLVPKRLVDTLAVSEAVILASEGVSRWVSDN